MRSIFGCVESVVNIRRAGAPASPHQRLSTQALSSPPYVVCIDFVGVFRSRMRGSLAKFPPRLEKLCVRSERDELDFVCVRSLGVANESSLTFFPFPSTKATMEATSPPELLRWLSSNVRHSGSSGVLSMKLSGSFFIEIRAPDFSLT